MEPDDDKGKAEAGRSTRDGDDDDSNQDPVQRMLRSFATGPGDEERYVRSCCLRGGRCRSWHVLATARAQCWRGRAGFAPSRRALR